MSSKKCPTGVTSKSVLQEWHVRVSSKKCLTRVSNKSVLQERCAIVSSKGVLQKCHLNVSSQGSVGIRVRGLHLVFPFWTSFIPKIFRGLSSGFPAADVKCCLEGDFKNDNQSKMSRPMVAGIHGSMVPKLTIKNLPTELHIVVYIYIYKSIETWGMEMIQTLPKLSATPQLTIYVL